MPIKVFKPTSPGRRQMSVSTFEEITRTNPEKSLTISLKSTGGRNSQGRITSRFRGGGNMIQTDLHVYVLYIMLMVRRDIYCSQME